MTSSAPAQPPSRPSWFEIHMELNPTLDRDSEWVRLNSRTRDDYARDDIASAIMIEGLERAREERERRAALAIADDVGGGP